MAFFGTGTRSSPIAFVDSDDEAHELYKDLNSSSSSLSVTLEKPQLPPLPPPEPRVMTESASILPYVPSIFLISSSQRPPTPTPTMGRKTEAYS